MRCLDGRIDTRSWNAQAFEAFITQLRTGRPGDPGRSTRLIPTYRELHGTSRIIAIPNPEQRLPVIDRLSQQPLAECLRFLVGCRELSIAFLGVDATGVDLRYVGRPDDVRVVITDSLSPDPPSSKQADPIREKVHWRTEDRLERTLTAIEELLDRLIDRQDVVFVMAWRLGSRASARMDQSLGLRRTMAHRSLVEFERRVLPRRDENGSMS